MQALTGLFARQFGTPNYAAHGGFCSVNMAAGMIYTIGGSAEANHPQNLYYQAIA
jgi:anaerobic selenocysteine-containing dehydrogenase